MKSLRGVDASDDLGAGADTAARCLSAWLVCPCVALGLDFGGLLYPMAVGGWFVMFTIPLAGLALIVWLVVLVVSLFMRRHR